MAELILRPALLDVQIAPGDVRTLPFAVVDGDGAPIDLTGHTLEVSGAALTPADLPAGRFDVTFEGAAKPGAASWSLRFAPRTVAAGTLLTSPTGTGSPDGTQAITLAIAEAEVTLELGDAADATARAAAAEAQATVDVHAAAGEAVHGIADTADLETQAAAQARVSTHAGETSGVHGVGASTVESEAGAQAKADAAVDAHAATPHPDPQPAPAAATSPTLDPVAINAISAASQPQVNARLTTIETALADLADAVNALRAAIIAADILVE